MLEQKNIEEKKKPSRKAGAIFLGLLLGLVVGCGVCVGLVFDGESSKPTTVDTSSPLPRATFTPYGVTYSQFSQLTDGMNESAVRDILNASLNCELISENSMEDFKTSMYQCDGIGSLGANMNFMIQNGKLISKAQFGLK